MSDTTNVFLYADPHFFHKNIIQYEQRPFANVAQMHSEMISEWNSVITNTTTVFILGDLSFGKKEDTKNLIAQLKGKKILITGNHDTHSIQWYTDVGMHEVYRFPIIYKKYFILTHEPLDYMPKNSIYVNIHGHVHSSPNYPTFTTNSSVVCVERWNYKPVSIFTITKNIMKLRNTI